MIRIPKVIFVLSSNGVDIGSSAGVHSQVLAQILLQRPVQVAGTDRAAFQFRQVEFTYSLARFCVWLNQLRFVMKISYSLWLWMTFFADMDGDALHSSMGLPPALHVTTAKVGKLEIVVGDS